MLPPGSWVQEHTGDPFTQSHGVKRDAAYPGGPLSPGVQGRSELQRLVSQQEQGLASVLLSDRPWVLPGAATLAAARGS